MLMSYFQFHPFKNLLCIKGKKTSNILKVNTVKKFFRTNT